MALLRESGLLRAGAPVEVGGRSCRPGGPAVCRSAGARQRLGGVVRIDRDHEQPAGRLPAGVQSRRALRRRARRRRRSLGAAGHGAAVDGGVVVSGRWPFCSGITHADRLFAGCLVDDQRVPSVVALGKEDLKVLDTWHTLGLRGTGSHDTVADEVFVPADRVFSLFDGPVLDRPLYRFPVFGFFALSIAAAALGNARAAIDDLVELAGAKKGLGSSRTLGRAPRDPSGGGNGRVGASAAQALYYQAIEAAWQASQDGEAVSVATRNRLRLAATHAVRTSADVVRNMYDLAGGTAIYDSSPLQRRFRDAYTATAHFQVNEASRELPGRILLDQPADVSML